VSRAVRRDPGALRCLGIDRGRAPRPAHPPSADGSCAPAL